MQEHFVAGNPVGYDSSFVGREKILRNVLSVLESQNDYVVLVVGPRRIGKTSFLQKLEQVLDSKTLFYPVYFNLEDKAVWPLSRILQNLAKTILAKLKIQLPTDIIVDDAVSFQAFLLSLLNKLNPDCTVVLLFDEFDIIADPLEWQAIHSFYPFLKTFLSLNPKRLKFLLALGRDPQDLRMDVRALLKSSHKQSIGLLDRKAVEELTRHGKGQHFTWSADAMEKIWELTSGHPYLTQQLLKNITQAKMEEPQKSARVLPQDVLKVVEPVLVSSHSAMSWLWKGLPRPAAIVATIIANAMATPLAIEDIVELLRQEKIVLTRREIRAGCSILVEWYFLEPVGNRYRFRIELLRLWVQRKQAISIGYDELWVRTNSLSDRFYYLAKAYKEQDETVKAIENLEKAIDKNPHNFSAIMLLADIYLKQGDFNEAARILQGALDHFPAAMDKLAYIYEMQIKSMTDKAERLALTRTYLLLVPESQEFPDEKAELLYEQFSALEASQDYENADKVLNLLISEFPDLRDWSEDKKRLKLSSLQQQLEEAVIDGKWHFGLMLIDNIIQNDKNSPRLEEYRTLITVELAARKRTDTEMRSSSLAIPESVFNILFRLLEKSKDPFQKQALANRILFLDPNNRKARDIIVNTYLNIFNNALQLGDMTIAWDALKQMPIIKQKVNEILPDILDAVKTLDEKAFIKFSHLVTETDTFNEATSKVFKYIQHIWTNKAKVALQEGDLEVALQAFKIINAKEEEITQHRITALEEQVVAVDTPSDLLRLYGEILELHPNHKKALQETKTIWLSRGQQYMQTFQLLEALEAFKQASLTRQELNEYVLPLVIDMVMNEYDDQSLLDFFQWILQLDPQNEIAKNTITTVWIERGKSSLITEDVEAALEFFRMANASAEQVTQYRIEALEILAIRAISDEVKFRFYDEILNLDPANKMALSNARAIWLKRGQQQLKSNQLQDALKAFEQFEAFSHEELADPQNQNETDAISKTWIELGKVALKSDDLRIAKQAFHNAQLDDLDVIRLCIERFDQIITGTASSERKQSSFQQFLKLYPTNQKAHSSIKELLMRRGYDFIIRGDVVAAKESFELAFEGDSAKMREKLVPELLKHATRTMINEQLITLHKLLKMLDPQSKELSVRLKKIWLLRAKRASGLKDYLGAEFAYKVAGLPRQAKQIQQQRRRQEQRIYLRARINRIIRFFLRIQLSVHGGFTPLVISMIWLPYLIAIFPAVVDSWMMKPVYLLAPGILVTAGIGSSLLDLIKLTQLQSDSEILGIIGDGIVYFAASFAYVLLATRLPESNTQTINIFLIAIVATFVSGLASTIFGYVREARTAVAISVGILTALIIIEQLPFGLRMSFHVDDTIDLIRIVALSIVASLGLAIMMAILTALIFFIMEAIRGEGDSFLFLLGILTCFLWLFFAAGPWLILYGGFRALKWLGLMDFNLNKSRVANRLEQIGALIAVTSIDILLVFWVAYVIQ